ncbi:C-type lectin domain family 14 member A [Xiphias gladius]|uniref:C-type lectin domain family 14 member A n=1 Tax=Xiphias gladius TaxID=8245 RepID=UPI001A996BA9|nr:C-type lectin domain family 14 member A [Xiphias gladius]
MASWFSSCWIYLWIIVIFRKLSADSTYSPSRYTIHRTDVTFDKATEDCFPGVLTTLASEQEVASVLGLISESVLPRSEFTFWVGLKKAKNECVVPTLPLRGFKWTEDGSQESQVSRWVKEPQNTCTTVRCAVLQGEFDGSTVTRWGLIPVTCKNTYQFICKLRDTQTRRTSDDRETTIKPGIPEPKPAATEPLEPATTEPKLPRQGPEPETDLKLKTEPELKGPDTGPVSGPALGLDSCHHPRIPGSRSLSPDPNNSSRILVDCWSTDQLELHCWGRPAVWHLLDNSPANFTTVCQPCSNGFRKDAFADCVDIDECSSAPCRHTCLNTEGSYRCVCSDEHGRHHNESSPVCTDTMKIDDSSSLSGILIPVLVAVVALVVLVVLVAVTVKCCLMKRSKKRSMKKSEKMAMKNKDGQDSFATANEKAAT